MRHADVALCGMCDEDDDNDDDSDDVNLVTLGIAVRSMVRAMCNVLFHAFELSQ